MTGSPDAAGTANLAAAAGTDELIEFLFPGLPTDAITPAADGGLTATAALPFSWSRPFCCAIPAVE